MSGRSNGPQDGNVTYGGYLKLDQLLMLQEVATDPPEHDETLFIIIHQVYELWFKLLLHEIDKVKRDFSNDDLFGAIATFKRLRMVMKTLVAQLDVLETMTPMSFLTFRDRLESASGFQSWQFRELEFVLGYKRPEMLSYYDAEPTAHNRLERRLGEPSVIDHWYEFLEHRGVDIPRAVKDRDVRAACAPNDGVQEGLVDLYREQPDVGILLELMMDFDEGQQEWRYRHVKMVERTIGRKRGTGGSPGVEFLKRSLFNPFFPDLWAIRHKL